MDSPDSLEQIAAEVSACRRCRLWEARTRPVPGEGPSRVQVMIVGEGPGEQEDQQGRPFVGRAGKLLTSLLEAAGLPRETVFIGNVVKCRPPGNRPPRQDEMRACFPYLQRQIALLQPAVIVALGSTAATALLGQPVSIIQDHGRWREASVLPDRSVPVFPTFHPAAALRSPAWRQGLEADLAALVRELPSRAGSP